MKARLTIHSPHSSAAVTLVAVAAAGPSAPATGLDRPRTLRKRARKSPSQGVTFPNEQPPDGIYVMNADGSGNAVADAQRAHVSAWSPDGRKIAFVRGATAMTTSTS